MCGRYSICIWKTHTHTSSRYYRINFRCQVIDILFWSLKKKAKLLTASSIVWTSSDSFFSTHIKLPNQWAFFWDISNVRNGYFLNDMTDMAGILQEETRLHNWFRGCHWVSGKWLSMYWSLNQNSYLVVLADSLTGDWIIWIRWIPSCRFWHLTPGDETYLFCSASCTKD
jgi:hypothetical protein